MPSIRLLKNESNDDFLQKLKFKVVTVLIQNPPYHLSWLRFFRNKDIISQIIVDNETDLEIIKKQMSNFPDDYFRDLLALRGLLAEEVLCHCLYKRNRVDFGIPRGQNRKKRLAVPFRGADTPSEKSEFSHPDVAICLTILAYYADGLTSDETIEAFKTMLSCGESVKKTYYNTWFSLSKESMPTLKVKKSLDSVEKLDLSNMSQREHLVCLSHLFYYLPCTSFQTQILINI